MAREATLTINWTTDFSKVRAELDQFIKESESRNIRLGVATAGAPLAAGEAPATFGDRSGRYVTPSRIQFVSGVINNQGASLQMQNGMPGAAVGGLAGGAAGTAAQAPKIAADTIASAMVQAGERVASRLESILGHIGAQSGGGSGGSAAPPELQSFTKLDRALREVKLARKGWVNAIGTDEEAMHWQYLKTAQSNAQSVAEGPLQNAIPVDQGGRKWITPASVAALAYAGASAMVGIADAGVISGRLITADARQAMNRANAVIGATGPLSPFVDLTTAGMNWAGGRGFVSERTRRDREITQAEATESAIQERSQSRFTVDTLRSFDSMRNIEMRRQQSLDQLSHDLADKKYYDESTGKFTQAGENLLAARGSVINATAEREYAEYANGIVEARGAIWTEFAARIAASGFNRYEALYQRTLGKLSYVTKQDPGKRSIIEAQAEAEFQAGVVEISRGNQYVSIDQGAVNAASQMTQRGSYLAGRLARIEAERNKEIREIGGTDDADLDVARGYKARRDTANQKYDTEAKQARIDEARRLVGISGGQQSMRLALDADPLGAQIASIQAKYSQQLIGVTDPEEISRITQSMNLETSVAKYQYNKQSRQIGFNLDARERSVSRRLARDPVGARAWETAGSYLSEAQSMYSSGRSYEAERVRRIGVDELKLQAQEYGYSFRGQQIDTRLMALTNPRDVQDPMAAYGQINDAMKKLKGENFGANNAADAGGDGEMPGATLVKIDKGVGDLLELVRSLVSN